MNKPGQNIPVFTVTVLGKGWSCGCYESPFYLIISASIVTKYSSVTPYYIIFLQNTR